MFISSNLKSCFDAQVNNIEISFLDDRNRYTGENLLIRLSVIWVKQQVFDYCTNAYRNIPKCLVTV
jgi:hypothetical protein